MRTLLRSGTRNCPRKPLPRQRGSALLIVLGFLSFMMISAVAFAVYMRIERQASSNYRHATTARHMLNSALFRAIDEIDGELRVPAVNGVARGRKFPEWPGRVRPSAVSDEDKNALNARVLSLDALSFIPGILVNDVRRYAVPNEDDPGAWCGAKWRTISMPGSILGNDSSRAEIGRFSYVCVNVSDMLNVNVCRAGYRDSATNRVSIGHLFKDDNARKAFDNIVQSTDRHYESLQDFYACMNEHYPSDPVHGSPFHQFLEDGRDNEFDVALSHILVTDGAVKAEPQRNPNACNIIADPPFGAGVLAATQPATIALQATFRNALVNTFAGRLESGATADSDLMAAMIADYIDEDGVPKRLNMPSVEMAPMISQILVPQADDCKPRIVMQQVTVGTPPATHTKNIYYLKLFGDMPTLPMSFEVAWPFKNQQDRTQKPAFTLEVQAYYKVMKTHQALRTQDNFDAPNMLVRLNGKANVPDFWNKDTSRQTDCFDKILVNLTPVDTTRLMLPIVDSEDGTTVNGAATGFTEGTPFSVALVVFAQIKDNANVVDSVPQASPYPGSDDPTTEFLATPKLFFQTAPSAPVARNMAVNPIAYDWSSLEVPDPRFNYKAANWIKNSDDVNDITPKINPSAVTRLLGQDGRDGDIYMSVADTGELQSPGELGFIVRPFPHDPIGPNTDFRNQDSAEKASDSEYMFRTIRLYDHGDPSDLKKRAHDPVYDNFAVENQTGFLRGARVNPLSDIPRVLEAAVDKTPADFFWSSPQTIKLNAAKVPDYTLDKLLGNATWGKVTNGWVKCLMNARTASSINTQWNSNLADVYNRHSLFGWYSKGNASTLFDTESGFTSGSDVPASLSKPLYEVDRKMLYAFSLDAFSDRQQLFIYILRAETVVPSFGGSTDSGVKSLAGGRAIAVVWRDPYPMGYNKANNSYTHGSYYTAKERTRASPWYQHNTNGESTDEDSDDSFQRLDSFHQHRILFFRQLDN